MVVSTRHDGVRDQLDDEANLKRRLKLCERCVWGHSPYGD